MAWASARSPSSKRPCAFPGSARGSPARHGDRSSALTPDSTLFLPFAASIVRYFSNHGLGVSLALGLVAGKGASFLSSITSYPLSDRYGTRGPFIVSTSLAGLSFAVNILYLIFHARLHPAAVSDSSHKSDEAAAERVIQRRKVKLMNLSKLGDVFWIYIVRLLVGRPSLGPCVKVVWLHSLQQLMNVFSGAIWSPFLHLSS